MISGRNGSNINQSTSSGYQPYRICDTVERRDHSRNFPPGIVILLQDATVSDFVNSVPTLVNFGALRNPPVVEAEAVAATSQEGDKNRPGATWNSPEEEQWPG